MPVARKSQTDALSAGTDGRRRVIVERLSPEIDCGRFAIKRVIGEPVLVEADIFTDGHDAVSAVLKYRHSSDETWSEVPMESLVNDRWKGSFTVTQLGVYCYTVEGWVDHFKSWRRDLDKKFKAGQEVALELQAGAELLLEASDHAPQKESGELMAAARELANESPAPEAAKVALALNERVAELMSRHAERKHVTRYKVECPEPPPPEKKGRSSSRSRTSATADTDDPAAWRPPSSPELRVIVDPVLARFGAWYELFPRSCAREPGRHGTFRDVEALLPRIANMGFDILYLPPIHPIGNAFRKGPNNTLNAPPGAPGSPWAIGSEEGGHKSIHPELGTLEDFRNLVQRAAESKIQIALDVAYQCSPDHPYVRKHPEWFKRRPDGSIQYAENPPKKYQDIYPINFESEDWPGLWIELRSVFEFWIEQGVNVFRVDNPHTKAFRFWEWCIGTLKEKHPETIFLSEAFTRPKVMYQLAKLGFTQSYNYFPWRNSRWELATYLEELTRTEVREFFRPNLWPNTPDILTQFLQVGGKPAHMARFVLAATLGASYGIYGPPFELCENEPRENGSEEYRHSEKYEIRHWDRDAPGNLTGLIASVNRIRRENPSLHTNERLQFHQADNEQIIAYSKETADLGNIILVLVNLDPHYKQSCWLRLDLERWGIGPRDNYQVHDLLTETRYLWNGPVNYVELQPHTLPAHIFRVRRYVRTEHDFDYFA